VTKLRTTSTLERVWGSPRRVLVFALDQLTASSPRLVAAAQILWTFANWNWGCVPSVIFLMMEDDLRAGVARLEPYRDPSEIPETERPTRVERPLVARHPAFRRAARCS
jgi:hypothetical protein